MPLMSILTCNDLEKEVSGILASDDMIDNLFVIGAPNPSAMTEDLEKLGLKAQFLFPETIPSGLKKRKGFNVLVAFQDTFSSDISERMKKELYERIKFYGLVSNGVLMFHGSCGEIFDKIIKDFRKSKFLLEMLSSDDITIMSSENECFPEIDSKGLQDQGNVDKYADCYNKLKQRILSQSAD